jgi:hypothetical protein
MPVRNDADDGTIYTVGRPRPTLTFEMYALVTSGVAAGAAGCQLARCGFSPIGWIGLIAALATFGLLAYDLSRKAKRPKPRKFMAASASLVSTPDLSGYDFGPLIKLPQEKEDPLPGDFDADCIVVFYDPTGAAVEAWIGGVADSLCMIRYINNPRKSAATDPAHLAVSP